MYSSSFSIAKSTWKTEKWSLDSHIQICIWKGLMINYYRGWLGWSKKWFVEWRVSLELCQESNPEAKGLSANKIKIQSWRFWVISRTASLGRRNLVLQQVCVPSVSALMFAHFSWVLMGWKFPVCHWGHILCKQMHLIRWELPQL